MGFSFPQERECPACGHAFREADQRDDFDPVVVVVCPSCQKLLWLAGSEEDAKLVVFDPEADAGGI